MVSVCMKYIVEAEDDVRFCLQEGGQYEKRGCGGERGTKRLIREEKIETLMRRHD